MSILWFLVKIVNKTWMDASHHTANRCRCRDSYESLVRFEYLDIMGLFETGWIVYPHTTSGRDFGYPAERT